MAVERKGADAGKRKPPTARQSTVSIVGAGRLGTALARAMAACGYTIESVVARRLAQARRAAQLSGASPLALSAAQLDQLPASDLIFITTPDNSIAETAAQLAAFADRSHRRQHIALHASGALSCGVLDSLRDAGFHTGSMHPLISVSDPVKGAESLREAFYCVEGDAVAARRARALVRHLGGQHFSINSQDKALYHAAAVISSGHLVALFDIAVEMLMRCGLAEKKARAVLLPLVRSAFENLAHSEPARALTGTFARADTTTVRRHLNALRSTNLNDALAAYILLGQRSLQLAERNGAEATALKEIARALDEIHEDKS